MNFHLILPFGQLISPQRDPKQLSGAHHYAPSSSPEDFLATSQHSLHTLPGGTDRI